MKKELTWSEKAVLKNLENCIKDFQHYLVEYQNDTYNGFWKSYCKERLIEIKGQYIGTLNALFMIDVFNSTEYVNKFDVLNNEYNRVVYNRYLF